MVVDHYLRLSTLDLGLFIVKHPDSVFTMLMILNYGSGDDSSMHSLMTYNSLTRTSSI